MRLDVWARSPDRSSIHAVRSVSWNELLTTANRPDLHPIIGMSEECISYFRLLTLKSPKAVTCQLLPVTKTYSVLENETVNVAGISLNTKRKEVGVLATCIQIRG